MARALANPAQRPYFYVAVAPTGKRQYGVRSARSRPALADALRREKHLLLRSYDLPAWAARGEPRFSLKDHAVLDEQLAQLLSRGVPLVEALEVAAATVRPRCAARVLRMREKVAAGSSFADACRTAGEFDEMTCAVFRAAERTGDLAGAARQLADTAKRTLQVRGKAVTVMVYPAVVLGVSLAAALALMATIVPRIGTALADADITPPWYSKLVFDFGAWMQTAWMWLALGVAGVVVGLVAARKRLAAMAGYLAWRLPMVQPVLLAQEAARFFATMAAMVRSGVPLSEALGTANGAITHRTFRAQMDTLRQRLVDGGVLRLLIDQVTALPLATRRLLIAAERAGDLDSAFSSLARDMSEEVDKRSQRAVAILQPVAVIFMFLVIGVILMAVLVPIITLSGQVGG